MNVLGIGSGELLLILLIVLLVVGPERLPQLARQWAKYARMMSQFTRTWQQFNAELNRQLTLEEMVDPQPRPAPPPPPAPEPDEYSIAPPKLAQQDAANSPTSDNADGLSPALDDAGQTMDDVSPASTTEVRHE